MLIHSKIRDCEVKIAESLCEIKLKAKSFFLIDQNVYELYHKELSDLIKDRPKILTPATEQSKSLAGIEGIYKALLMNGFKRNDMLCVIGGGVMHDVGGFVASTLYRGVRWTYIPTTLLAQVDTCIGGKTGINFGGWKNQIGTFYPPDQVYIVSEFVRTLSEKQFRNGLGEMMKVHIMEGEASLSRLKNLKKSKNLSPMIQSSLQIKKSYVEKDEFDVGRRNLLNYGHCVGHALESASQFEIAHGEAVILGMAFANLVAVRRGILSEEESQRIERIIRPFFAPVDFTSVTAESIISHMKHDKKRSTDQLAMILLQKVGSLQKVTDIAAEEIVSAYENFKAKFSPLQQPNNSLKAS